MHAKEHEHEHEHEHDPNVSWSPAQTDKKACCKYHKETENSEIAEQAMLIYKSISSTQYTRTTDP